MYGQEGWELISEAPDFSLTFNIEAPSWRNNKLKTGVCDGLDYGIVSGFDHFWSSGKWMLDTRGYNHRGCYGI